MNFRKLLTYFAFGTAAIMPFADAQSPTIVQGNYITNVFGNSNFVLNPNAQTNTANIAVLNATVLRSPTTPLVATSEANVTVTVANGTIAWSTRTFDEGIKNQNCEARFTYRGFQSTSIAQVRQGATVAGANVVAQLTLTPSVTDPRIASINFPCGDLSQPTYFVITDTATLSGINEIGGIYVGLATNQANVAQAEMVGAVRWQGCATPEPGRTGSTAYGNLSGGGACSTKLLFGKATSANEADASITFNNLPPGNYFFQTNTFGYFMAGNITDNARFEIYEDTSGAADGRAYLQPQLTTQNIMTPLPTGWFTFTNTANRTFRIRAAVSNPATTARVSLGFSGDNQQTNFVLYRFPSSSELVVKPETQNTYAGLKGLVSGGSNTNSVTSASWTKLTSSATLTRTPYGKAKVESNNDISITIDNMPVGSYYVTLSGYMIAKANGSGDSTACFFALADTATGGAQIAGVQQNAVGDATKTDQEINAVTLGGIYQNTSVASKTFFLQAYRAAGLGSCYGFSDANRIYTISVIPLDQPSNSALYVQGPVLGAQTGATIPSGYVGELRQARASGCGSNSTMNDGASISITSGIWRVVVNGNLDMGTGTLTDWLIFVSPQAGNVATWRQSYWNDSWWADDLAPTFRKRPIMAPVMYVRYDGTTMYRFEDNVWKDAYVSATGVLYAKFYRTSSIAPTQCYTAIVAERVN